MTSSKRARSMSPDVSQPRPGKQLRPLTPADNNGIVEAKYFIWQSKTPALKAAYTEVLRVLKRRVRSLFSVRERLKALDHDLTEEKRVQICYEIYALRRDYEMQKIDLATGFETITNVLGTDLGTKLGTLPKELRDMVFKELTIQSEPVNLFDRCTLRDRRETESADQLWDILSKRYYFRETFLGDKLSAEVVIAYYKCNTFVMRDSHELEYFLRNIGSFPIWLDAPATVKPMEFISHLIVKVRGDLLVTKQNGHQTYDTIEDISRTVEPLFHLHPERRFRLELQIYAPTKPRLEEIMRGISWQYEKLLTAGFIVEVTCAKHKHMWYPKDVTGFFGCSAEAWKSCIDEYRKTAPELCFEDLDDRVERSHAGSLQAICPRKSIQAIGTALLKSGGNFQGGPGDLETHVAI